MLKNWPTLYRESVYIKIIDFCDGEYKNDFSEKFISYLNSYKLNLEPVEQIFLSTGILKLLKNRNPNLKLYILYLFIFEFIETYEYN